MNVFFDAVRFCALLAHEEWAQARHAHPAIAASIHAVSTAKRTAEEIFDSPTDGELRVVAAMISRYIARGLMIAEPSGEYAWGWRNLIILHVGATIDIGVGDDRDSGRVLAVGERRVFVAWESGVTSWAPISSPWVHTIARSHSV